MVESNRPARGVNLDSGSQGQAAEIAYAPFTHVRSIAMPEQPLDRDPLQDRLHVAERERDEARRWSQRLLWLLAATILLAVVSAGSAGWGWAKLESERADRAIQEAERTRRETEARLQRQRKNAADVQRT